MSDVKPTAAEVRRARAIAARLAAEYPEATCALTHANPLQLLVATILSAQCTDARVNMITPALFARYPDARAFAEADTAELERMIQSAGFFRNKAKNIKACCQRLVEKHGGEVPRTMDELIELAGVARKTANVVLGNAYGIPGIAVDTHVGRLSRRMGFTRHQDPVKVEFDLYRRIPAVQQVDFNHQMIFHGRRICAARKPRCDACVLADLCPKIGLNDDLVDE